MRVGSLILTRLIGIPFLIVIILLLFHCKAPSDTESLTVEIVKPEENVPYWDILPLELTVSCTNELDRVEIFFDDRQVHVFTKEPFTIIFNYNDFFSDPFYNPPSILKVVAYDQAGNTATAERDISTWYEVLAGVYQSPSYHLYISGSYAYIANREGLLVIDISSPSKPILTGSYELSGGCIYVHKDHAYISNMNGLHIINISNPSSPTLVAFDENLINDICIAGNYAYLAIEDFGLEIMDITDPTDPVLIGSFDGPNDADAVFVSNGYAYLLDFFMGLYIIDVSDPSNPTLAGTYENPNPKTFWQEDIFVSGDYAYKVDTQGPLEIIDISQPTNPSRVGIYHTYHEAYGVAVFISGHYAHLISGSCYYILDVSDPSNPSRVGYHCKNGGLQHDIFVSGRYTYIATSKDLLIYDISGLP